MRRVWRVKAFGAYFDAVSLAGSLAIIGSFKQTYGPDIRVTLRSYIEDKG